MMRLPVLAALVCLSTAPAWAAPRCSVEVTRDASPLNDPGDVLHKGDAFGPVTFMILNTKTGVTTYCAEHSFCYPAVAFRMTAPCTFRVQRPNYQAEGEVGIDAN